MSYVDCLPPDMNPDDREVMMRTFRMTAADDMYAVLKEALEAFDRREASGKCLPADDETRERIARARAALAKAEGR